MGRSAMQRLKKIWKDRNIKLDTKTKLVKTLVFPVALYGCETSVMKKRERERIGTFELWCWRRMLKLSWTERKTNSWVLQQVKPERSLESKVILASLRYVGHILRSSKSIEKDILTGITEGHRKRGRPKTRYWDNIKAAIRKTTMEIARTVRDRNLWRRIIHDVTRSHPRIDGT